MIGRCDLFAIISYSYKMCLYNILRCSCVSATWKLSVTSWCAMWQSTQIWKHVSMGMLYGVVEWGSDMLCDSVNATGWMDMVCGFLWFG